VARCKTWRLNGGHAVHYLCSRESAGSRIAPTKPSHRGRYPEVGEHKGRRKVSLNEKHTALGSWARTPAKLIAVLVFPSPALSDSRWQDA